MQTVVKSGQSGGFKNAKVVTLQVFCQIFLLNSFNICLCQSGGENMIALHYRK